MRCCFISEAGQEAHGKVKRDKKVTNRDGQWVNLTHTPKRFVDRARSTRRVKIPYDSREAEFTVRSERSTVSGTIKTKASSRNGDNSSRYGPGEVDVRRNPKG